MSSDGGDWDQHMGVVDQRIDFIELLDSEGRLETREIMDRVDDSRSTVNRALRDLRDAGLVERTGDGYAISSVGVLAAQQYRRYHRASRATYEARELLQAIPKTDLPPTDLLVGADLIDADSDIPVRALEALSDRVQGADTVRAYLPTLVDTHLLRVWHRAVVSGAVDSDAIFDPELLTVLKGQYPQLLSEMAAAGSFSAHAATGQPYAVVLTETEETATVSVVVYDDNTAVQGVVTNESSKALAWARGTLDDLQAAGEERTGNLQQLGRVTEGVSTAERSAEAPADAPDPTATGEAEGDASGHALPLALESEGFVRLSPTFFGERESAPPGVSWRTGFTLPEVRAGQAVDRLAEDGQPLADHLVAGLGAEDDHVVLGPPGSGKSTLCMSVACRWDEQDRGPVLYREADDGDAFDSTALLRAYLRETDGHALVVEDAVREQTSNVFEVMQAVGDDPTVTFLLDARTREWDERSVVDAGARVERYRQSGPETVRLPPLDRRECERFVETFDRLVGGQSLSGAELFARLSDGRHPSDGDTPPVGTALTAQHYLSQHHQSHPDTGERSDATVLEETVDRVYRRIATEESPATLDVAVLVATLNAAGIPVAPEYLYAVAERRSFDDVEAAIASLRGDLLFEQDVTAVASAAGYRTHHDLWSVRFLERFLADRTRRDAQTRFDGCLGSLLGLADDPDRRTAIERVVDGPAAHLHRIEADPAGWASELLSRLFTLGQTASMLAPLFGDISDRTIRPPDACPDRVWVQMAYWRGRMYRIRGDLDRADRAFHELTQRVDTADVEDPVIESGSFESTATAVEDIAAESARSPETVWRGRWRAQAHLNRGAVARAKGDLDTAARRFEGALDTFRDLGDDHGVASARKHLGVTALRRGDVETGTEYLERSLDQFQRLDDPHNEAKTLTNLGVCAQLRGDTEQAVAYFEQSRGLFREVGDRYSEAKALGNMGNTARERGDLSAAREYRQESLRTFREIGARQDEATALAELGLFAREQGDEETALSRLTESLRLFRTVGDARGEAKSLNDIGEVWRDQGQYEEAVEYFETALDVGQEAGARRLCAETHLNLGRTARQRGDFETACTHSEQALDLFDAVGDRRNQAEAAYLLGTLRRQQGDTDRAVAALETAADLYCELKLEAAFGVLEALIALCEDSERTSAAIDWCRRAEQFAADVGADQRQHEFADRRQALAGDTA